jgi:hypothetical protein
MSRKAIVFDANILIRAVMGKRVRELVFRKLFHQVRFRTTSRYQNTGIQLVAFDWCSGGALVVTYSEVGG